MQQIMKDVIALSIIYLPYYFALLTRTNPPPSPLT